MKKKILIIRFSSFGDIVQSLSMIEILKANYPDSEVHWLVRSDLSSILVDFNGICKIWSFDRKDGLLGLIRLAFQLKKEKFDLIYDAHNNLRSKIVSLVLCPLGSFSSKFLRRYKERIKRLLLFKFRIDLFPQPYKGMFSYKLPLKRLGLKIDIDMDMSRLPKWNFNNELLARASNLISERFSCNNYNNYIVLVPSAAWKMKRWPLVHWKELVKLLDTEKIVILGGPDDDFCKEIEEVAPQRILSLTGMTSLLESCAIVKMSKMVITADTGLLHVADLLEVPTIALLGPTAFGHPSSVSTRILEQELSCRPCTKDGSGKCTHTTYQKCMTAISPIAVSDEVKAFFLGPNRS